MNALSVTAARPKKVWVVVSYVGRVPFMLPWTARETKHEAWLAHVDNCCSNVRPVPPEWAHLYKYLHEQRDAGELRVEKALLAVTR